MNNDIFQLYDVLAPKGREKQPCPLNKPDRSKRTGRCIAACAPGKERDIVSERCVKGENLNRKRDRIPVACEVDEILSKVTNLCIPRCAKDSFYNEYTGRCKTNEAFIMENPRLIRRYKKLMNIQDAINHLNANNIPVNEENVKLYLTQKKRQRNPYNFAALENEIAALNLENDEYDIVQQIQQQKNLKFNRKDVQLREQNIFERDL